MKEDNDGKQCDNEEEDENDNKSNGEDKCKSYAMF